jgi:glycosyltransferase involved in cell wall biosynthesis
VYAVHIKKSLSLSPVAVDKSNKLFIYSFVIFYGGRNTLLSKFNDYAKRMQYGKLNMFFNQDEPRRVLLLYPPSEYLPEAIKCIKHEVLIADLVDDNLSRATDMAKKKKLSENYKNILPKCRWIFSTSPVFKEVYRESAKQEIDYLPNGVDIKDEKMQWSQGINFQAKREKTIGYFGIINKEVNMDLLEYIVAHHSNVDFLMVGQATNEHLQEINKLVSEHDNFIYLGPKSHNEIPALMKKCDVLINVKNNDYTTSGADSIKIYEYLATGKPIVATPMPPADRFADLMYVTSDKFQYSEFIRAALAENDSELRRKRMEVARDNSWPKRVDVILEKVSQLL